MAGARNRGSAGPADMMGVKGRSDVIYSCDQTTEESIQQERLYSNIYLYSHRFGLEVLAAGSV